MSAIPPTLSRSVRYRVDKCPLDGKPHEYQLDVQYQIDIPIEGIVESVMADREPTTSLTRWKKPVEFICPDTHKSFTQEVSITPLSGEKIVSVSPSPPGSSSFFSWIR